MKQSIFKIMFRKNDLIFLLFPNTHVSFARMYTLLFEDVSFRRNKGHGIVLFGVEQTLTHNCKLTKP